MKRFLILCVRVDHTQDFAFFDIVYTIHQSSGKKDLHILELLRSAAFIVRQRGGVLRLGSRGKTARYENGGWDASIPGSIGKSGIFRLYLATPAIFEKGCLPGIVEKYNLTVLAAAINGYVNVGGYDIKANRPKPMRRAVPAGSVY